MSNQQQELHKRATSTNPNPSVQVTAISSTTESTPPGFNRGRRFIARWVLWLVVLTLMSGKQIPATICSAMAIILLKEGTIFSGKNIKWMGLSGISFLASLGSWCLEQGYEIVDEEKAYSLKISLWLASKAMQVAWGVILAAFLFSATTSKSSIPTSAAIIY